MSNPDAGAVFAATRGKSPEALESAPPQQPSLHHPRLLLHSPPMDPTQLQQAYQQRSVKRPRPVKSCTECRKRKLRCDRLCPCLQCQKSSRACRYAADYDSANLSDGSEPDLENARPTKRVFGSSTDSTALPGAEAMQVTGRREAERPPSVGMGFIEELAVRMDRLEKQMMSGGSSYTRLYEKSLIPKTGSGIRGMSVKRAGHRTRLFGQISARVLSNLVSPPNLLFITEPLKRFAEANKTTV